MPSVAHIKRKERLALAMRIEAANRLAQTCSYCRKQSRKCLLELKESSRCSECVRSKRSCDTAGYPELRPPPKMVCRFFCGPRRKRVSTPVALPSLDPLTTWLPAFDFSLAEEPVVDPSSDVPALVDFFLDPSDPFWADLGFGGGMPQASQDT